MTKCGELRRVSGDFCRKLAPFPHGWLCPWHVKHSRPQKHVHVAGPCCPARNVTCSGVPGTDRGTRMEVAGGVWQWMTSADIWGRARGISLPSARKLVRRSAGAAATDGRPEESLQASWCQWRHLDKNTRDEPRGRSPCPDLGPVPSPDHGGRYPSPWPRDKLIERTARNHRPENRHSSRSA